MATSFDFYYAVTSRILRHFKSPFATDETGTVHGSGNPTTEAVNELVANALIHADYGASSGSGIGVILKADSLTAHNPGSFLIDQDVAIAGGYSESRNPTLMRILSFIGASDRAGSGLEMIFSTWRRLYGVIPTLEEAHSPSAVILSLPFGEPQKTKLGDGLRNRKLDYDELLSLLADSPLGLTPREIHELTGASERVAQKRLRELFEHREVSRSREGHFFRYTVDA